MLIYRNIKKSLNQNDYINIQWIYLYDIHTPLHSIHMIVQILNLISDLITFLFIPISSIYVNTHHTACCSIEFSHV